jgi:hypothetical protein
MKSVPERGGVVPEVGIVNVGSSEGSMSGKTYIEERL